MARSRLVRGSRCAMDAKRTVVERVVGRLVAGSEDAQVRWIIVRGNIPRAHLTANS